MANEKNINSRIQLKHDVESNWQKATGFIPKAGELIIYDKDASAQKARIKIGDGTTTINDLPFISTGGFDFIITGERQVAEYVMGEFDRYRRESLEEALADKYGSVYVADAYLDSTVVEVPEAITYIEFNPNLFRTSGGFLLQGASVGCQVVRNLYCPDGMIRGFLGGVEHCHSGRDGRDMGLTIEYCNNISHCDVSQLTECNNINDCTYFSATAQMTEFRNCHNINNLIIHSFNDESYTFTNCSYLSNIVDKNPDTNATFIYNNCTYVDPYTCAGFIPDEDIGKVRTLTNDGSINLIDPADKTYVQEKIAEAELAGEDVDLSAYATKDYVDQAIAAAVAEIKAALLGGKW